MQASAQPSSLLPPTHLLSKSPTAFSSRRNVVFVLTLPMDRIESDVDLLNAARAMDKEALAQIFDRYAEPLYRYALRMSGDPNLSDQIVGDVFSKLLEKFSSGAGPRSTLRSYLYETVYHRMIDEARAARRKAPLEVAEWIPPDRQDGRHSLEEHVLYNQAVHAIRHHLTPDQRHVISLRFLEGFSLNETADITGKKVEHVKVIQSRGMAALRRALTERQGTGLSLPMKDDPSKSLRI